MKGHKQKEIKTTACAALEDVKSEVECLRDEMEEWASGMEGTGLESTQKYETITNTYEELESAYNELEQVEISEEVLPHLEKEITFTESHKYGNRGNSRNTRCMNVCSALTAVKEHVGTVEQEMQDKIDTDIEDEVDSPEELVDQQNEVGQMSTDIQGALDYLESVEFPGMYG